MALDNVAFVHEIITDDQVTNQDSNPGFSTYAFRARFRAVGHDSGNNQTVFGGYADVTVPLSYTKHSLTIAILNAVAVAANIGLLGNGAVSPNIQASDVEISLFLGL